MSDQRPESGGAPFSLSILRTVSRKLERQEDHVADNASGDGGA